MFTTNYDVQYSKTSVWFDAVFMTYQPAIMEHEGGNQYCRNTGHNLRDNADDLAGSSRISVIATVYATIDTDTGLIFESFTQQLEMRAEGPLTVVGGDLISSQSASFAVLNYEQMGTFDYTVRLKPESPFGAMSLKPPAPVTSEQPLEPPPESTTIPLSSRTTGPEEPILFNLLDGMDVRFSYYFRSDQQVNQLTGEVEITAVLEDPDVWRKELILVPRTQRSGDFTIAFKLSSANLSHFRNVFDTIQEEVGGYGAPRLIIKTDVHTTAQTATGPIEEAFTQTLTTELGGTILEWEEEELTSTKLGTKGTSRVIPNPTKIVGLSLSEARVVFPVLSGIFLAIFVYLFLLYMRSRPEKPSYIEEEALRARKKHQEALVDVEELPEAEAGETVISFSSLDELVKTADSLLKPVLHKAEPSRHTYCVIDSSVRYEYVLTANIPDNTE